MLNATKDPLRIRQAVCDTERYLQDEEWGEGRVLGKEPGGREKVGSQGSKPISGAGEGRRCKLKLRVYKGSH